MKSHAQVVIVGGGIMGVSLLYHLTKEDWTDIGFLAQDVEILEEEYGHRVGDETNLVTDLTNDGKRYSLKYERFVPILAKAIQELSAENTALAARITTLEG